MFAMGYKHCKLYRSGILPTFPRARTVPMHGHHEAQSVASATVVESLGFMMGLRFMMGVLWVQGHGLIF